MGTVKKPLPVKLILGMISSSGELLKESGGDFQKKFGEIDYLSPVIPFTFTSYYSGELGGKPLRQFASFKNLIDSETLPAIKIFSNSLEEKFQRRINLDPGYVNHGKLVLATTKDQQHRIYLADGIFAEVTLRYHKKSFCPWDWTYPDYRTAEYIEIFNEIRKIYAEQIKNNPPLY